MNDQNFSKNLIKGKIAQIIFEQMFREQGEYTVIPFGYENILPEIFPQNKNFEGAKKAIDNIRNAPDYTLISIKREKVYLVEVKYRNYFDINEIISIAKKQMERWHPSCVFVATNYGFYFDVCSKIVTSGRISKLSDSMIAADLQVKYLELINEFEK